MQLIYDGQILPNFQRLNTNIVVQVSLHEDYNMLELIEKDSGRFFIPRGPRFEDIFDRYRVCAPSWMRPGIIRHDYDVPPGFEAEALRVFHGKNRVRCFNNGVLSWRPNYWYWYFEPAAGVPSGSQGDLGRAGQQRAAGATTSLTAVRDLTLIPSGA